MIWKVTIGLHEARASIIFNASTVLMQAVIVQPKASDQRGEIIVVQHDTKTRVS